MYEYRVKKVHKVVDGDTIDVDIDLGFSVSFFSRVRLAGIDTPESRTTDAKEKVLGLELAAAKDVVIKTEKPDSSEKYGRILGWVFLDGSDVSLNQKLINEGYAWTYGGGTKIKDFNELVTKRQVSA
jgi:micrococcal nuclease